MDSVADAFRAFPVRHAWALPGLRLATRTEENRRQLRSFLGAGSGAANYCAYRSQDAGEELDHASELLNGELRQQLGERTRWLRGLGPLPFIYQASNEAISGMLHSADAQNPRTMYRLYVLTDCAARVSLILLSIGLFSTAMHQASNWLPKEAQNLFNKITDIGGATTSLCFIGIYVIGVGCLGQLVSEGRRQEDSQNSLLQRVGRGLCQVIHSSPGWVSDVVALMALRKLSRFAQIYAIWRGFTRGYQIYKLFAPSEENPLPPLRFHSSRETEDFCALRQLENQLEQANRWEAALEGLSELERQTASDAVRQRAARARDQAILKNLAEGTGEETLRLLSNRSLNWARHVPPPVYRYLREEGGSAGRLLAAAELDAEQREKIELPRNVAELLTPDVCREISQQRRRILYNPVEKRDYYHALAAGRGSLSGRILGTYALLDVLTKPAKGFHEYLPWGPTDALSAEQYAAIHRQLQPDRSSRASQA